MSRETSDKPCGGALAFTFYLITTLSNLFREREREKETSGAAFHYVLGVVSFRPFFRYEHRHAGFISTVNLTIWGLHLFAPHIAKRPQAARRAVFLFARLAPPADSNRSLINADV